MELVKFLNSHKNDWREKLAAKPYYIEIKNDGPYFIFKYNMLESDMHIQLVKECRGCICRQDDNGNWICVCYPFIKFGNWGESYADTAKIDWSRGVDVQTKVDGSLCKIWFDRGHWHISTNNTIDAFSAPCGDSTFGDVFLHIYLDVDMSKEFIYVDGRDKYIDELFKSKFNPNYTYCFEMVHPQYNPIVVHYDKPALYLLGARSIRTGEEVMAKDCGEMYHTIQYVQHYHYDCLDDVLKACAEMGADEEGYVVVSPQKENGSFLRIKCKGTEYLTRHKLRGNGPLTAVKVISLWQTDSMDDFLAYFPEHTAFVDTVAQKLIDLIEKADIAYDCVKGYGPRREFALRAQSYIKPIQSYLFARLDNKIDDAFSYFKQMKPKNLADLLDVKDISHV